MRMTEKELFKIRCIALEYAMEYCLKAGIKGDVVPTADYFYRFLISKIFF